MSNFPINWKACSLAPQEENQWVKKIEDSSFVLLILFWSSQEFSCAKMIKYCLEKKRISKQASLSEKSLKISIKVV